MEINKQQSIFCLLPVNSSPFLFALQVQHDYSINVPDEIRTGDFLVCDLTQKYRNGDLIIVSVNEKEEPILRKYMKEGAEEYLLPLNNDMTSLKITPEIEILAKVIKIINYKEKDL